MKQHWKKVWVCLSLCLWACPGEKEVDLKNPPPKSFRVLVSGEELVAQGIPFSHGGDTVSFEDGWTLTFESAIVTLAQVQLSENPDMSSGDLSMTGPVVAELEGVFAVELKSEGGFGLHGDAHALGVLTKQNQKKDSPAFDSQTRYAFGYSLVRATPYAVQLGFGEDSKADYARMQEAGYSVFVRGRAEHKSESCRASEGGYDFGRLPKAFEFELGFDMPVRYRNCQNPNLGHARGVQVKDNAFVDVVATLHFDHLFWEALEEDAKLRLDAWAARRTVAAGAGPDMRPVRNADLAEVDYEGVEDAQGNLLPFRSCEGEEEKPGKYEAHSEGGGLRNLNDFIRHNLSAFGHLNGSGLCEPQRLYP
jgi:hypothetical protein